MMPKGTNSHEKQARQSLLAAVPKKLLTVTPKKVANNGKKCQ
jgi:hypothetical protein